MAKHVLNIATLIERPQIKIDEGLFEIKSPDELSVVDHHRLQSQGRRLEELMAQDTLNVIDEVELGKLLTDISTFIMVGVPEEVQAKLTDSQRTQVCEVFTSLPLRKQVESLMAAEATSIGEKPQRASNDSTGERHKPGFTKSPSHSSRHT
ncbi:hypothetical protein LCGC14_1405340 [marine sediment metagenome]|uniref:Uncharacterized protein n=1 Tax=marine sediment metagenome TaxID=412755 RepID=A0A0F9JVU2_9ZZZZ